MKQLLLVSALFFLALPAFAQFGTCESDPIYQDSMAGVYPLPYDAMESPDGGIPDSACLNKPFQFVFNAVVSDTLSTDIGDFALDSLKLQTEGAVSGMPEGLQYACDPPNCVFEANTVGCVVIYGTATNPADLGDNELTISATIFSQGFPLPLSFPDPNLFPGSYSLYVHEEDYPNCTVVMVDAVEAPISIEYVRNVPNPFSDMTTIEVATKKAGTFNFRVTDMLGNMVHLSQENLLAGTNRFEFDGSQLAEGMYLFSFQSGNAIISQKMMISRQ